MRIPTKNLGHPTRSVSDPDASESNHLGTTRLMTDAVGAPGSKVVYTAFGERITSTPDNRYGYAGAYGYQSHTIDEVPPPHDPDTVFPYLHVGHLYYDPATARFLQRDPIGLWGGLNVYEYVQSLPTRDFDPGGLMPIGGRPPYMPPPPRSRPKPKPKRPILPPHPLVPPASTFACCMNCTGAGATPAGGVSCILCALIALANAFGL